MKIHKILPLALIVGLTASCKKENESTDAQTTAPAETVAPASEANKYNVETSASTIHWTGSKPSGKHHGTIGISDGQIFVKDSMIQSGKFTIDMKSITVNDLKPGDGKEDLEAHLKGLKEDSADHFFNTNKYPTGTFEITGVTKEGSSTMIEGNLTIKDITKNIKFPAAVSVTDSEVTIKSEAFKINRVLWNVSYNSRNVVKNLGDKYIDDDIELKVDVKATK